MANLGAQGVDFNGEIILTSNGAGGFKFTDSNNSTLMSKATITNDISSLVGGLTSEEEQRDSDVSSLAADVSGGNEELNSDVSSLAAGVTSEQEQRDSDVSSLAGGLSTEGQERDSDVSSLAADVTSEQEQRDSDVSSLAGGLSTEGQERDSDVSSLAADVTSEQEQRDSDVSSLAGDLSTEGQERDSDVSSLAGGLSTEGQERDSDVSSLAAGISGGNEELNSDISSLQINQSNNTVITAKANLVTNDASKAITWTDDGGDAFTFDSAPSVVAVLRNATANAVIIPCMVSAASTTGCTVVFADGMPSNDYVLEIIASN